MYGSSGQTVYAFVGSSGTGSMATGSATNYANMTNATYGKDKTAGGFNFEADAMGGVYQVQQYIGSANSSASFAATGSGTTAINSMTTGASGDNNADLGWGGGCYTNANMTATGVGSFMVSASGSNRITTPIADASGATVAGGWTGDGDGTAGSVSFQTVMSFITGGSVGNFSVKVQ